MICPHCMKTIDDGETFCPHCHGYVGGTSASEFVFCEGCGARLSIHDRTCPKCGRPAPGILSTESASSDLAAGKTASFPRLTKNLIQTESDVAEPVSAARALDDSVDPSDTNVLDRSELERRERKSRKLKQNYEALDEDPYHPHKRSYKGLIIALVLLAAVAGSAAFVVVDPLNVMPGFYAWFQEAARDTYPSRQVGDDGTQQAAEGEGEAPADGEGSPQLTDEELYIQLSGIYDTIMAYNSSEAIGEVIDSFNSWFLASDLSTRQSRSQSAYSLRDAVQGTIDQIDALNPSDTTVYTETIDHMRQLAEWMYGRVNQICESWDVSLAVPEGESVSAHQDEILAPMREAGQSDLENFDTYAYQWRPLPPEETA